MITDRDISLPKARTENLIVKELPDETLVYDVQTDQAHCLNKSAAWVWKHCDGQRTVAELSEAMAVATENTADESLVWLALDQLDRFNLLTVAPALPAHLAGMSRRQWVRKIGLAAIALPMIISISAQPAHAQASLLPPGRCCGNPTDCASNSCSQSPSCVPPPPVAPSTKACN